MKTVEERVKEIIIDQLMVDDEQLTPGANLVDDLGADSLDVVELVMLCEEEFELEADLDDVDKLVTVQDVVEYVTKKVK